MTPVATPTATAMAPTLRLAVWQCPSLPLDVAANLARIEQQARLARAAGAQLLVCPEMILTGYAIGAPAVQRLAEAADGPSARQLARLASDLGIAIACGYPERGADGHLYNAALLFGADACAVGRCRKTQLYGERDRAVFTSGAADEPLVTVRGWRIGLAICYDIEFPECARRLALAGADVIVVPTANMEAFDVVPLTLLPARAVENQLFVAYANYCGPEGDLRYDGLSRVVGPDGRALAAAEHDEALLIADLSAEQLDRSRAKFTYLQDRRTDL